jgi:hypothetical protein
MDLFGGGWNSISRPRHPDRPELSWATGHFCTDFSSLLRIRHTKAAGTMIGFDLYILLLRELVSFTLAIGLIITAAAVATILVLAWAALRLSGDMRG